MDDVEIQLSDTDKCDTSDPKETLDSCRHNRTETWFYGSPIHHQVLQGSLVNPVKFDNTQYGCSRSAISKQLSPSGLLPALRTNGYYNVKLRGYSRKHQYCILTTPEYQAKRLGFCQPCLDENSRCSSSCSTDSAQPRVILPLHSHI